MNLLNTLSPVNLSRYEVTGPVVLAVLLFAMAPRASADIVTVNSGASVTYLDSGSTTTDFPSPFTPAQFAAAQTGPAASVLSSAPFYFPASDIPGAVWIGTNINAGTSTGDTALYAISFDLPSTVSSASLGLDYGVDNALGDTNPGIYINGTALPGSTGIPCGIGVACGGAFTVVNTYTDPSIGSLLVSGRNTIYFDAVNLGEEAGLIFSADITYTPTSAVPEPSSLLPIGTGLALIGVGLRKRLLA
jgi:hypothetical protein